MFCQLNRHLVLVADVDILIPIKKIYNELIVRL